MKALLEYLLSKCNPESNNGATERIVDIIANSAVDDYYEPVTSIMMDLAKKNETVDDLSEMFLDLVENRGFELVKRQERTGWVGLDKKDHSYDESTKIVFVMKFGSNAIDFTITDFTTRKTICLFLGDNQYELFTGAGNDFNHFLTMIEDGTFDWDRPLSGTTLSKANADAIRKTIFKELGL